MNSLKVDKTYILPAARPPASSVFAQDMARSNLAFLPATCWSTSCSSEVLRCALELVDLIIWDFGWFLPYGLLGRCVVEVRELLGVGESDFPGGHDVFSDLVLDFSWASKCE